MVEKQIGGEKNGGKRLVRVKRLVSVVPPPCILVYLIVSRRGQKNGIIAEGNGGKARLKQVCLIAIQSMLELDKYLMCIIKVISLSSAFIR